MGTAQVTEWDLEKGAAVPGGIDFAVDFDPTSLSLTYTPTGPTQGSTTTASGTFNKAPTQQTGQSTTLALDLTFDTSADGSSVQARTDRLVALTSPGTPSGESAPPRRVVRFSWGTFLFFGTVSSLSQTIGFFSEAGVPLRSEVRLSLTEVKRSNPAEGASSAAGRGGASAGASFGASFGASAGASFGASASIGLSAGPGLSAGGGAGLGGSVSVGTTPLTLSASGDTLQSMSARAGGTTSWKAVAAANGIDNPRLIPPGTVLDVKAGLSAGVRTR